LVHIGLDWKWTNEIKFPLRSLASHIHEIFNGCSQSSIVLLEVDELVYAIELVEKHGCPIQLE